MNTPDLPSESRPDASQLLELLANEDELQRAVTGDGERLSAAVKALLQDSPALMSISIISRLSRTPAVGLMARFDILTWLVRTTSSFDFVSWPNDSLRQLLVASSMVSRQSQLPPASLAAVSGSYINALLDIALEHLEDEETEVLNAALNVLFALNFHERKNGSNRVHTVISSKTDAMELGNAILALLNRSGDVLALDFVCDLLSETTTTDFFFTNDLRVLIDIAIRGLLDFEPENPYVSKILSLTLILSRTHEKVLREHKFAELKGVFKRLPNISSSQLTVSQLHSFFDAVLHQLRLPSITRKHPLDLLDVGLSRTAAGSYSLAPSSLLSAPCAICLLYSHLHSKACVYCIVKAAPIATLPARKFSIRSEWRKAREKWFEMASDYFRRETSRWRFWLRARWYNRWLAILIVVLVVVGAFLYWDMYISSDSPFGVVRRTVRFLETDPEFREILGPLRWFLSSAYTTALILPTWFKNVRTGQMMMYIKIWVIGKRRARVEVLMEETTPRHFECFSIQINYDKADTVTRTRKQNEGKHLY